MSTGPSKFPVVADPSEVACFACGILAKDARPMRAGADASHRDVGFPPGHGQYQFTCQCGMKTYYDLKGS